MLHVHVNMDNALWFKLLSRLHMNAYGIFVAYRYIYVTGQSRAAVCEQRLTPSIICIILVIMCCTLECILEERENVCVHARVCVLKVVCAQIHDNTILFRYEHWCSNSRKSKLLHVISDCSLSIPFSLPLSLSFHHHTERQYIQ